MKTRRGVSHHHMRGDVKNVILAAWSHVPEPAKKYARTMRDLTWNLVALIIGRALGKRTFCYQGCEYHYLYRGYNFTWRNERAVEVPVVWKEVIQARGTDILELGNVLSYYYRVDHDVLDKYERFKGVINQDVVDYDPRKRYNLIVSISTLEHVGWDEELRDPTKILRAIANLRSLLKPGGKMIMTAPVGYNPVLDKLIMDDKISFSTLTAMKRVSWKNEWVEDTYDNIRNVKKPTPPYRTSYGIVIGTIVNNGGGNVQ